MKYMKVTSYQKIQSSLFLHLWYRNEKISNTLKVDGAFCLFAYLISTVDRDMTKRAADQKIFHLSCTV